MTSHVIKRDKKRTFKNGFFIGLLGGMRQYVLVHQPSVTSGEQGMQVIFILAIFFCYLGSGIYLVMACLGRTSTSSPTSSGSWTTKMSSYLRRMSGMSTSVSWRGDGRLYY